MQEKLEKVPRHTLKDDVYDRLKQGLMQGRFSPGDVLLIRSLAEEMGTSIMPVREALQRLVAERALRLLPNRSVEVPETTRAEFNLLSTIRVELEGLAAELATAVITDDQIKRCHGLNDVMKTAVSQGDPAAVLQANMAFHFEVYNACGSSFLVGLIESLWLRAGPLLVMPFQKSEWSMEVFRSGLSRHDELLAALRARNAGVARSTLQADIANTAALYEREHILNGTTREGAGKTRRGR